MSSNRKTSSRIAKTEKPGKNKKNKSHSIRSTEKSSKPSAPPPKKEKTDAEKLAEWIAFRKTNAPGNPEWDIYDLNIKKFVGEMNDHLLAKDSEFNSKFSSSNSSKRSNYVRLDWRWIKAMVWTETGPISSDWRTLPMQIGKSTDPGIKSATRSHEKDYNKFDAIIPDSWKSALDKKEQKVKSDPLCNIQAGIMLLMMRMGKEAKNISIPVNAACTYEYKVKKGENYTVIANNADNQLAPGVKTTKDDLELCNSDKKVLHPGDTIKYREAKYVLYVLDWYPFDAINIRNQYNINPKDANSKNPGDPDYAEKLQAMYNIILESESGKVNE
ncbi:hypothetical protein ACNENL_002409 [Escherichia fergusonii]